MSDIIWEFICEVLLFPAAFNKQISKWITIPLLILLMIVYIGIIMVCLVMSIDMLEQHDFGKGMMMLALALLFIWYAIMKIKEHR